MNYVLIWLVLGTILCLMELLLPTAFVESTLGLSAFVVAMASQVLPSLTAQIILWMVLSVIFIALLRRFSPKQTPYILQASTEARTLTAIPPGQPGRVLYEGNSWQARCEDEATEIAENQRVVVTRRRGNTLYIMPDRGLND
ncbi:MAG: NfeD family protein [Nodosilinea sp. LVE1205-7]